MAKTLTERVHAVVRGMTDNRSNAFVEAMNGLLQQAKRAAWGLYAVSCGLRQSHLASAGAKG